MGYYRGIRSGGHQDIRIEEQQALRNLETDGGYNAKCIGNEGELRLSNILNSLPDYYHIIDNVLLQTKKGSTQIDHIIVSPFGIFVIETKNHKGMIFGDCFGKVWTQVLYGGRRYRMYSPLLQNNGHIQQLSKQTKIPVNYMQGIIVFTNDDTDLSNVMCDYCLNIDQLYEYLSIVSRPILTDKQVEMAIRRIDKINTDSYINRRKHIEYVNSVKHRRGY